MDDNTVLIGGPILIGILVLIFYLLQRYTKPPKASVRSIENVLAARMVCDENMADLVMMTREQRVKFLNRFKETDPVFANCIANELLKRKLFS